MKPASNIPLRTKVVVIMLVTLLSAGLCMSRWGGNLGYSLMDQFFFLRGQQPQPEDVIIVAIDEPSFGEIGLQWPWPRALHAELIDSLNRAGARTIAFDVVFAEPSAPAGDIIFAESTEEHGSVVLAADIQKYKDQSYILEKIVKPLQMFMRKGVDTGFVNQPLASDNIVRYTRFNHNGFPSFSYESARKFCSESACNNMKEIDSLSAEIEELPINFYGGARSIKTVSFYQALDPEHFLPKDIFKDKLVFVGLVTQAVVNVENMSPDYFPVPMTRIGGGFMSGVEIHAQIAGNLLGSELIDMFPDLAMIAMGLLAGILSSLVFFMFRPVSGSFILTGYLLLVIGISYQIFLTRLLFVPSQFLILPVIISFALVFVTHYYRNFREKRYISEAFGSYVSPHVVKKLVADPDSIALAGEEKELTVLFSDIRGFTTISEKMDTSTLAEFMHEYLGVMSAVAMDHNGTIDKFIGDAVMAIWGAPLDDEHHAANALRGAMAMSAKLDELNPVWKEKGYPYVDIGIGLNTGTMRVGNFGSSLRFDYTVIGDDVNLASRLEGATKTYGVRVIISETTREQVGDLFYCRLLDKVRVKGKQIPVKIFEPLAEGEASQDLLEEVGKYDRAIDLYQEGEFESSLSIMKELNLQKPCTLYSMYVSRLERLVEEPPDREEWDGVYSFTTK